MFKKSLFFSALLFSMSSSAFAAATHSAETEELLKVLQMDKRQQESINQIVTTQASASPEIKVVEKEYKAFLEKTVGWKAIKDDVITLWEQKFNKQEITDMTNFYKTTTGKKALEVMPQLVAEGMKIGMGKMQAKQDELKKLNELAQQRMKKKK